MGSVFPCELQDSAVMISIKTCFPRACVLLATMETSVGSRTLPYSVFFFFFPRFALLQHPQGPDSPHFFSRFRIHCRGLHHPPVGSPEREFESPLCEFQYSHNPQTRMRSMYNIQSTSMILTKHNPESHLN
jgi:hypothetical protein